MRSVSHRELRNDSAEVLRCVAAGETLIVTNRGLPAAIISPVGVSTLDALAERGEVRRATTDTSALAGIARRRSPVPTQEILDDVRGQR